MDGPPFERERQRVTRSLRAVADLVDAVPDEELPEALVRLAGVGVPATKRD